MPGRSFWHVAPQAQYPQLISQGWDCGIGIGRSEGAGGYSRITTRTSPTSGLAAAMVATNRRLSMFVGVGQSERLLVGRGGGGAEQTRSSGVGDHAETGASMVARHGTATRGEVGGEGL